MPYTTHARKGLLLATALLAGGLGMATLGSEQHLAEARPHRASTPMPPPDLPAELAEVREALNRYQDPIAAIRDGYLSTLGCVAYPNGAMGVHFINSTLIGPKSDPFRPPLLVYEPTTGGRLRLVAAEWFVPLATDITERPVLFGRPFDGPMEGHEPLMPASPHHYDLHVWLWKENPAGLFNAINPTVGCAGHPYALMEQPTAIMPHHRH
jgi:hypothetical protein